MISSAADDPDQEFSAFAREYNHIEVFDQPLTERELWDAVRLFHPRVEERPLSTFLGPQATRDVRDCPIWR